MSIYDTIGGATAVQAAVDDFYVRVTADPVLAPLFANRDLPRLKEHQRAFIAAVIGGPEVYRGRDMAAVHATLGLTDAHFDAVVDHLLAALTGLGVPTETTGQIGAALAPLRSDVVTISK
ncbi:group 1 truncated hemoglobin [Frankia sp. CcI156]|jgi:hemoglobin|uniref:Group 1 truncated hemoglobin n=1 Tax=Frankia casuarinae (strain DSM 45818 / CECT 9043 / HFP020203 / CcI3) TaxID=106370 RepID=Q2J9U9_FRACC|nr:MULTISPECIES: group 1 truncated hemoglobin [Frankia]ABD11943.1 globin [Frankia casuarinae]ETA00205.1 hemoglobin [Frankia sp. CcI6]EYT90981.1 hemoglobin [Frankia casuarinae]KDA41550.1 nonfunctional hemoglobin [Frankia sp. BMG5.23]KEZ34985.1 nonfunctional hemoglobin [Frankia sp. CeD]